MSGTKNQNRAKSSIPRTIREDAVLTDDLEDMDICNDNEFNKGLSLLISSPQQILRELYRLIVKRDTLKIRLPTQWAMDLVFTEIVTQENFGNYGNPGYEIMLPYEIFMIENIHYKGLVRFKNILNLPNKIRTMSLINRKGLQKSTELIRRTVSDYIDWLIQQTFNTHEEKRAHLKLFKSEYIVFAEPSGTKPNPGNRKKRVFEEIIKKAKGHLLFIIEISNSTMALTVLDRGKLFKLIKFNLKRDFHRVQKFQNQIDIEFSLKLTMFIEMARREMMSHI